MKTLLKTLVKNVKQYWLTFWTTVYLFFSNNAFADDAGEVFNPLRDKTDDITTEVEAWAASLSLLFIIIFGTMTMGGKFSKFWGICIVGGALIILVGSGISAFLLKA